MVPASKRCITLRTHPVGMVTAECFSTVERVIEPPRAGEVLLENLILSTDPYLRLRMTSDVPLGSTITARAVGRVIASNDPHFEIGDYAWGFLGWETHSVRPAEQLYKINPALGPLSNAISVRGMIGLTAWLGVHNVLTPQEGETVVVSAAAGAVGSVAGQLAKLAGARVVAITGGSDKAAHCIDFLGYDAAVDYKSTTSLYEQLRTAAPRGVDGYFDNVGGATLNTVIRFANPGVRMAMCGNIGRYNGEDGGDGVDLAPLLGTNALLKWFSVNDAMADLEWFPDYMAPLVASGDVKYHEHITEGFDDVVPAFLGLFEGANLGKRLVRIADGS